MKFKLALLASALLFSSMAASQPSDFFIWVNKVTGEKVCEPQMNEGQWVKESGPYEDANCKFLKPS